MYFIAQLLSLEFIGLNSCSQLLFIIECLFQVKEEDSSPEEEEEEEESAPVAAPSRPTPIASRLSSFNYKRTKTNISPTKDSSSNKRSPTKTSPTKSSPTKSSPEKTSPKKTETSFGSESEESDTKEPSPKKKPLTLKRSLKKELKTDKKQTSGKEKSSKAKAGAKIKIEEKPVKSEAKPEGETKPVAGKGGMSLVTSATAVGYNPAKKGYNPQDDACWKAGQDAPYRALTDALKVCINTCEFCTKQISVFNRSVIILLTLPVRNQNFSSMIPVVRKITHFDIEQMGKGSGD